jgi:hypothetical protein
MSEVTQGVEQSFWYVMAVDHLDGVRRYSVLGGKQGKERDVWTRCYRQVLRPKRAFCLAWYSCHWTREEAEENRRHVECQDKAMSRKALRERSVLGPYYCGRHVCVAASEKHITVRDADVSGGAYGSSRVLKRDDLREGNEVTGVGDVGKLVMSRRRAVELFYCGWGPMKP